MKLLKSLNDKNVVTVTLSASTGNRYENYQIKSGSNTIFTGRVFVPASNTSTNIDIYLNDIIKDEYKVYDVLEGYPAVTYDPIRTFNVSIGGKSYNSNKVFLGYVYPFKKFNVDVILDESQALSLYLKSISMLLQGADYYPTEIYVKDLKYTLYPRYPFRRTEELYFALMFSVGSALEDTNVALWNGNSSTLCNTFTRNNYVEPYSVSLDDLLDGKTYKPEVVVLSNEIKRNMKSGTKLYLVTVEGQNIYNDSDIADFAIKLGYSAYYNEHFYVQGTSAETIYYAVLTNDPTNDIYEAWDDTGAYSPDGYMSYEEVTSINNCIMSAEPKNEGEAITSTEYIRLRKLMKDFCEDITDEMIDEWGVKVGDTWGDTIQFRLGYVVPQQATAAVTRWINEFKAFTTSITIGPAHVEEYTTQEDTEEGDADAPSRRPFYYGYTAFFTEDSVEKGIISGLTNTYKTWQEPAPIKIADLDECPADFYLQWFDRFGGVLCLPFKGKQTKSINYTVTNITNRYDEVRPAIYSNAYNYDLNTEWLSEDEYVLYESIFVSPKLKLYDYKNNKSYYVIVTDKTFTEKTMKNQKKMFGFNIKLQINTKENILY